MYKIETLKSREILHGPVVKTSILGTYKITVHDLEVMGSNHPWVEHGVRSFSV